MSSSQAIAAFAADLSWNDLPDPVREQGVRLFRNALGNMLGGAGDASTSRLERLLAEAEPGPWRVPGCTTGLGFRAAVQLAGYCATLLDFDDFHEESEVHPGPSVAPVALLTGVRAGRTLGEVITAFVAGSEAALRIGTAAAPGHYSLGWHATATCGAFGATVAAGLCLGLDAAGLQRALGIALGRIAGTRAAFGTDLKPLHAAFCAESALQAALLAEAGFGGPADPLAGPAGFLRTYTGTPHPAMLTDGLGERWELLHVGIKAYPCGIVNQSAVTAALAVAPGPADEVGEVEVRLPPAAVALVDRSHPTTPVAARMSAQHCVAVALLDRDCGLEQFVAGRVSAPDVTALRDRILLVADETLAKGGAVVSRRPAEGGEQRAEVRHALGFPEVPLDDAALRAKFLAQAQRAVSDEQATATWELSASATARASELLAIWSGR